MPGDMSSSGAAGLAEPYLIYRKEDSIVDGRRLVPRKTRGWLRHRDVDIEKRRRIQHSAAAGGRRVSLEERMRSRRRALDEAWTKKAGRTNSWHRVLVGTSKGSPVRGAAWRVSGFLSTAKAGRWLLAPHHQVLGRGQAKPDMVRGGRSFSQGGWCRSPLHRASPNLFREKNRLGQRGTRTEAWSGPVFFLARSQGLDAGADRVSSCPGLIPICKWSSAMFFLNKTAAAWMRRGTISLNRLKQDGPPLEATHPRIHANPQATSMPAPSQMPS